MLSSVLLMEVLTSKPDGFLSRSLSAEALLLGTHALSKISSTSSQYTYTKLQLSSQPVSSPDIIVPGMCVMSSARVGRVAGRMAACQTARRGAAQNAEHCYRPHLLPL